MKKKMNKTMKSISGMLALTLTVILFSGCSADEVSVPQQSSVEVETQTAQLSPSLSETMFPATVESHNRANLSTIVMGTVTAAPITVGDRVKKGDLLVHIKDDQIRAQKSQIEANMVQAKANLENTEKNYNRIRNLYAEESATSKEMDDISTMYEIAKANMEALEARMNEVNEMLEYTNIRAPFDGIVSRKYISEGDMAAPGHPLVTVSDPGSVKIVATVAENQITKLSDGTDVSVSISSAGLNQIPARLTAISEAGDPMSRQFAIEAIIEDESINEQLKAGMFAEIRVNLAQSESLYIPASAIVQRGQLTGIYTISDSNSAVLRWVRLGEHSGERVEIITGLTRGEQFVVNPGKSIRQGQLISSR